MPVSSRKSRYLFSEWSRIKKRLRNKRVYFFLDYDGTLTPIAGSPEKAVLRKKTKKLLSSLAKMSNCKLAIISGRALGDIMGHISLKDIVYVGNHGFEMNGPQIKFKSPVPSRYLTILEQIKKKLQKELSLIKGVIIEDKGCSLCVHYRKVRKKEIPLVRAAFFRDLRAHEVRQEVAIRTGKMVLEVRPSISWDKGKAVLWLLARQKSASGKKREKVLPIYIGDDLTDEDAFRALKNGGVTISVGRSRKTKASYHVKDSNEAIRFLRETKDVLKKN